MANEPTQTPPNSPPPPAATGPVDDPAFQQVLRQSPTLRADIATLQSGGYTIRWGTAGGGTFIDEGRNEIVVDQNSRGNGAQIAQSLAHEIGHQQFSEPQDRSSRDAWVNVLLRDEAAATIKNARVREEIIGNGGPDIGFPGLHADQYKEISGRMLGGTITEEQARREIATAFKTEVTSTTGQTYDDYYGASYPGRAPTPELPAGERQPSAPVARSEPPSAGDPDYPLYNAIRGKLPDSVSDEQAMHATLLAKKEGIAPDKVQAFVHGQNAWVAADFPPGFRVKMDLSEQAPSMQQSLQASQALDAQQTQQRVAPEPSAPGMSK